MCDPVQEKPVLNADYYEAYLSERAQLVKNGFEAYRDYDKWLMTVAGSALALSITFLKDIVPFASAKFTGFALGAWASLLLSITACLVSVLLSPVAHDYYRKCMDEIGTAEGFGYDFWGKVRIRQNEGVVALLTRICNCLALGLFVLGMGFLIAFVWVNVSK